MQLEIAIKLINDLRRLLTLLKVYLAFQILKPLNILLNTVFSFKTIMISMLIRLVQVCKEPFLLTKAISAA